MLPVFIMAIEDDSDRQFAAELYHSYHPIMHRKALSILKKEDLADEMVASMKDARNDLVRKDHLL